MEKLTGTRVKIKVDSAARSILNHLVYSQTDVESGAELSPHGINLPESLQRELQQLEATRKNAEAEGIKANSFETYRRKLG